jgi:DNA-directed RNA polymerase subunit RPC12/RpoP
MTDRMSDLLAEQVEALQRRVRQLEEQLAAVTRDLEQIRPQSDSMRDRVRCPACGCRSILHAHKVVDRDQGQGTLAVTTKGLWAPKPVGQFEIYVCTSCGLVEWHVVDPAEIQVDGEIVEVHEVRDPAAGPYR